MRLRNVSRTARPLLERAYLWTIHLEPVRLLLVRRLVKGIDGKSRNFVLEPIFVPSAPNYRPSAPIMKPVITTSICKLFVLVVAFAAGPAFPQDEATPALSEPTAASLTVARGKPSGRYAAGTQVTVSGDVPPPGAHFTGWTGDVQILADPRSATTTAMVPFTPVTITATYSADSQDPGDGHSGRWRRDPLR